MKIGDLVEWKHNALSLGIILKKELNYRQVDAVYIFWFKYGKGGWQEANNWDLRIVSSCK